MPLRKMFVGPHTGYVAEMHERFERDPASVEREARVLFERRAWTENESEPQTLDGPDPVG
jgi:hypothetical protein